MDDAMRKQIEPIFNSLKPEDHRLTAFPPKDDDGDGDGSDSDLASIILYGSTGSRFRDQMIDETQIEFAIKLGRELEKNGIS